MTTALLQEDPRLFAVPRWLGLLGWLGWLALHGADQTAELGAREVRGRRRVLAIQQFRGDLLAAGLGGGPVNVENELPARLGQLDRAVGDVAEQQSPLGTTGQDVDRRAWGVA